MRRLGDDELIRRRCTRLRPACPGAGTRAPRIRRPATSKGPGMTPVSPRRMKTDSVTFCVGEAASSSRLDRSKSDQLLRRRRLRLAAAPARRSVGKGCMSGGKAGATAVERISNLLTLNAVVPALSPRSLATCTLCPHAGRPHQAPDEARDRGLQLATRRDPAQRFLTPAVGISNRLFLEGPRELAATLGG